MFEFKADAQMYYDKVANPVVKAVHEHSTRKSASVGIKGVSKCHRGERVYYKSYIWVTRHTVNKQLVKTFKTLEEAVAQRQEWEQVKAILDGKVVMVLPFEWEMVYASKYWEVYHGMAQEQDEDYER